MDFYQNIRCRQLYSRAHSLCGGQLLAQGFCVPRAAESLDFYRQPYRIAAGYPVYGQPGNLESRADEPGGVAAE